MLPPSAYHRLLDEVRRSNVLGGVEAAQAITSVLGCLAEGLSGAQARKLLDQLPEPVAEQARPYAPPPSVPMGKLGYDEFLAAVSVELGTSYQRTLEIIRTVFQGAQRNLDREAVLAVAAELRSDLGALWRWPSAAGFGEHQETH